MIGFSWC